jgi:hypothetical protein
MTETAANDTPPTLDEQEDELLYRLAILKDRKASIEELIERETARLRIMMKNRGEPRRQTELAQSTFYEHRTFEVHDPDALAHLFTLDELAHGFKPTAEFYDAAKKAGVEVEKAITVGVDERFKVERRKTAKAREMQDRIINETMRETEARVNELARRMRLNRKGA